MRFIHMADMHFDSPFVLATEREEIADKRRLEKRKIFKNIVEYIKKENIPYLFISGDLYEQEYIRKSTIDYINNLFKEIEQTKIFIVPGNHDPYLKNSYYAQYKWNKNVKIFTKKLEVLSNEDIDIYGYGFENYYMENPYSKIEIKNKEKINILLTHGDLDGAKKEDKPYNEIKTKELQDAGFDYVALGHIHKKSYNDYLEQCIVYPGSTAAMGFDEEGEHGIIEGYINKKGQEIEKNIKFIKMDTTEFVVSKLNISELDSMETLIEYLNEIKLDENKLFELVLEGTRNFEIDKTKILKMIKKENIIKIKDNTTIEKDTIESLANDNTLRGIFANNILEDMKKEGISTKEKEELEKIFETGMRVLK